MTAVNPIGTADTELDRLGAYSALEQAALGYLDTLREIVQQPATWRATAAQLAREQAMLRATLTPRPTQIVFTGSGSSLYVGEGLAAGLQAELGIAVQAIAAGTLLTHRGGTLPPGPALLVSIARSGDSPESCGVVDEVLAEVPDYRHLFITCNADGRLATRYRDRSNVTTLVLDPRTNDRSLVMTGSFTNLLLAGRGLAWRDAAIESAKYEQLAAICEQLFDDHSDALATTARGEFEQVVYLGSGVGFGAAREAALKMVEMTAGRVKTLPESYLGLRHGPMSSIDARTLIVAFISSDPTVRAFELDLLRELHRKQLGVGFVLVGEGIPADVIAANDVVIDLPGLHAVGDELAPAIDVVVGQLLAFFRCLQLGFKPDTPSEGVLTRVVQSFALHGSA